MSTYRLNTFLITIFLVLALVWGVFHYNRQHYRKTDGFSARAIQFSHPLKVEWETKSLSTREKERVDAILGQKFSYLSKGARSYAFQSQDGKYVLKFFKYRYAKPHWTVRFLPKIQPFEYFRQKKIHKVSLDTVLTGYKIAYEKDPQGTGVLFVHLNPAIGDLPIVEITDKAGSSHSIDLNSTRFVLQRRAKELQVILKEDLEFADTEGAKRHLVMILDLYLSHFQKGIYDTGTGLIRNNGFLEGKPIHFDVGKMTLDPRALSPEFQYLAMIKLYKNGDKWLADNFSSNREEISLAMKQWIDANVGIKQEP